MSAAQKAPVTVIVPTRNEGRNLRACLESVQFCARIVVVDSQSTDDTGAIAAELGAEVHQFHYTGGWPKKRQWALDNVHVSTPWVLLLDADERVTPPLREEILCITNSEQSADGYWITLRLVFLGKVLRFGATGLQKLSFFRTGKGRFECLLEQQDATMSDVEIHEHLIVDGREGHCRHHLLHENVNNMHRYIEKHNEYSSWSAAVMTGRGAGDARLARLGGVQAERRRWLSRLAWRLPCRGLLVPLMRFVWFYVIRLGFLDGRAGFYYCGFKAVQAFHIAAKVAERGR